jgi:hypothetical protein
MNSIDLVRLFERGAPAQKLWALVLLLAIRDGATRVWFDPAQGDNRLGYEIGGVEKAMVPPPEFVRPSLLKVIGNLMRRRSAWGIIAWLFAGRAARSATVEDSFVAQIGEHGVTVTAVLDRARSRVILRLSPETGAVAVARAALESCLNSDKRKHLRG